MKSCWEAKADFRPSFSQMVNNLCSLLESMSDYLEFFTINNPNALDVTPPLSAALPNEEAQSENENEN